jgi:Domain of unknown function (DUF4395)
MRNRVKRLLLMQGFCQKDIEGVPQLGSLARWTPLSCAVFGTVGIWLQGLLPIGGFLCPCVITGITGLWLGSGWFFIVLGLLTLTGGMTTRSIYDRLYNSTLRYLFRTPPVPQHGSPRKFGCAIGGIMYIVSGIGFLISNYWLAFIPALFMVVFATIAGLTQWCFASAIYAILFKENRIKQPIQRG